MSNMEAELQNQEEHPPSNDETKASKRKRRYSATDGSGVGSDEENGDIAGQNNFHDPAKVDDISCGAPAAKYREVDAGKQFQLYEFSDEVLFEIFKHLDSWTLLALMNCCDRFHTLVLDHRFWNDIDLSKEPLPQGMLQDILERTHINTHSVKLRGPPPSQHVKDEFKKFTVTLAASFSTRCTQLTVLELQGVTIDFRQVHLVDFPTTLKRLVFNECNVCLPECVNSIFSGIDTHLTKLEELAIENNHWFEPYHIMILSKAPSLRWLSLRGCQQLFEMVPYGSMAARFGFKHLEYLDIRFTPISDADLQCFNAVVTLKELLLDCPEAMRVEKHKGKANDCESEATSAPTEETRAREDNELPSTSSSTSQLNVTVSLTPRTSNASCSSQRDSPHLQQEIPPQAAESSSSSSSTSSSSTSSASTSPPPAFRPGNADVSLNLLDPPHSRFLPRPDQVIYLDLHNRRRPIIMRGPTRRPANNANHLDQVLNHPLFWDMINPLGRFGNVARAFARVVGNEGDNNADPVGPPPAHMMAHVANIPPMQRSVGCLFHNRAFNRAHQRVRPISDRGICCFGRPQNPVEHGVIWIRIGNRPSENNFERLSVRNYKQVTDISLQHLVQCSPRLMFLDLSGTSVTRRGVHIFKNQKPECQIVADHLISPDENIASSIDKDDG